MASKKEKGKTSANINEGGKTPTQPAIVTFDENEGPRRPQRIDNFRWPPGPGSTRRSKMSIRVCSTCRLEVVTNFRLAAPHHAGQLRGRKGITHVNILGTIEAICTAWGKSGEQGQQPSAGARHRRTTRIIPICYEPDRQSTGIRQMQSGRTGSPAGFLFERRSRIIRDGPMVSAMQAR